MLVDQTRTGTGGEDKGERRAAETELVFCSMIRPVLTVRLRAAEEGRGKPALSGPDSRPVFADTTHDPQSCRIVTIIFRSHPLWS